MLEVEGPPSKDCNAEFRVACVQTSVRIQPVCILYSRPQDILDPLVLPVAKLALEKFAVLLRNQVPNLDYRPRIEFLIRFLGCKSLYKPLT